MLARHKGPEPGLELNLEHFTPFSPLFGGMLIGLSASILLLANGRVAGISGILGGALSPVPGDALWRAMFLLGLIGTGTVLTWLRPESFQVGLHRSVPAVALAGLLVGYGTRLGNGCTSGHGVCGLSRTSPRSLFATLTFMATGAATVFLVQHLMGGRA